MFSISLPFYGISQFIPCVKESGRKLIHSLTCLSLAATLTFAVQPVSVQAQGYPDDCTFTQGYWKNHTAAWPVDEFIIGGIRYTQAELLAIFNQPVGGNGLVSLAHQLIAAKLNIAYGADPGCITLDLVDANNLINGLAIPPTGAGYLHPSTTSALVEILDDFNNDVVPGCGACIVPVCAYSQGYWKNHTEAWPVENLTLGTVLVPYDAPQLLAILKQPVQGNGLVMLARQLIAAKLNVENGTSDSCIADTIAAADALIGDLIVPPVGTGSIPTSSASSIAGTLESYNTGFLCVPHCGDEEATETAQNSETGSATSAEAKKAAKQAKKAAKQAAKHAKKAASQAAKEAKKAAKNNN